MKDFEKTKRFVDDINFLCNAICNDEFYSDGFFHQRAMEIYRRYSWSEESGTYDEQQLITEFLENVEVQSIEGMQNAFDIWKNILNGIKLPDCDQFNYAEATKDKRHREDGLSILEMVVNLCGAMRREVEGLMSDYHLQNRSHTTHFLAPPYYEFGDVGDNATHDEKDRFRAKSHPSDKTSKRTFRDYISADADMRLKKAHMVKGKGAKALRKIIQLTLGKEVEYRPTYTEFEAEFKDIVCYSEYYRIMKDFTPSIKTEKLK